MKKAKLFSMGVFALFQFLFFSVEAQQGKDLAGNITGANTVVNVYTNLTAGGYSNSVSLSVGNATGFSTGDLVMIIQMYGAEVNAYMDPNNFNNSLPNDTSYGKIKNYNSAGLNEFQQVSSVGVNTINLDCGLKNKYDSSRAVQVIRVPRYTSLTITFPGTIVCPAWNGVTGGVVAIEVQGNTIINNNASIDVSGRGYRGGVVKTSTGYGATNTGSWWPENGAIKGESIVGDTTWYHNTFSGSLCKANVANGGGGGDAMNCGGGGGSNGGVIANWNGMGNPDMTVAGTINNPACWLLEPAGPVNGSFRPTTSSGGGRGGYSFSSNNNAFAADPTITGPNNGGVWGSDDRHNDGGWGGIPLDYTTGRIFMGGGGGAGDSNDGDGTGGATGGGIVYLMSYGTVSGAGQILADGAAAAPTFTTIAGSCRGDDGAGGGGGGGAVFINSVGAITLTNATPVSAQGGKGGDQRTRCPVSTSNNYGPGGGGGGGHVSTSNAVTSNVNGGANGIVTTGGGNNTRIATKFPPNGATSGGAGGTGTVTNFYLTTTNYTICAGTSASLSVTIGGTPPSPITVNWYTTNVGGSPVGTGNPYNTGALTLGTYTYYVGTCPGTYRAPVIVTVLPAPSLTVVATPTAVCSGQQSILSASGASSYTWSANAGSVTTSTAAVNPTVLTTYTVTGANGTCVATQTVSVAITSAPTLTATATPTAVCSGQQAILTASGASSYTWSANAGSVTTATAAVNPVAPTVYTVTGANGGCISTQTVSVAITSAPTLTATATPTAVCSGQQAILTASGATSYTWSANAGSVTTATAAVNPTVATTYTVTGANGTCISTQTVSVAITTPPSLTVTASPTSVCAGQQAVLTASGATSYTWDANAGSATTATVAVTPTLQTTYTVTGDNAGCISTQTVTVNITAPPTLTITATPAVICNGQSTLLTGSGAGTYTWTANAGGVTTNTVSVSPTSSTSYTLTGDNGGCTATQVIAVTVNNGPTSLDSAFAAAACGQSNGSYTINVINGGSPNYQVNFNNTGFTPITSLPYVVGSLAAAVYPVVIQDNNGCTYTTSVVINNSGGITQVDSTTGNASCNPPNSGYIVLNSVTGGTGPYQVEVNGGGFNNIPSFPDTLKNLTAGVYTVTVRDNSGCLHTTMITVGSNGAITASGISFQNAACTPPNSGIIFINSITGGTGPFQYSVNGGPLTTITTFPDSIKNVTAGSYTVVIQDAMGCTNTSVINVGSQGGPTAATTTLASDTCSKGVGTLVVSNVSGGFPAYQYSMNGGPLQSSNTFTGLAGATVYTITVQDNNGCTYTFTDSLGMIPAPSPTVTAMGLTIFCEGGSVVLSSSSATGNTWSTSATTQTISVTTSGVYSVSVSQNGCTAASNTIAVTVNPTPTITVNSAMICTGGSTSLAASGGNTYTWSPATGLSSTTGAFVTANPGTTTVYTITALDGNNCPGAGTATVTVNPLPSPPLVNPDTLYYCLYQPADSLTASAGPGATLNWYDVNMNPLPGAPVPSTSILGTTTYYVSQTQGICQGTTTPIVVMVVPGPSAVFTTNPVGGAIMIGQPVIFTPSQQNPLFTYLWNFADPGSSSNTSTLVTPTHIYDNVGLFCPQLYVISNQTGCADSSTLCIEVIGGVTVTIPNVFSPNDDKINDVFSIKTEGIKELAVEIYDRWGLKMYGWNSISGYWDGTTNGKRCSDGTYFYVVTAIDYKGIAKTYHGYLQLLK